MNEYLILSCLIDAKEFLKKIEEHYEYDDFFMNNFYGELQDVLRSIEYNIESDNLYDSNTR